MVTLFARQIFFLGIKINNVTIEVLFVSSRTREGSWLQQNWICKSRWAIPLHNNAGTCWVRRTWGTSCPRGRASPTTCRSHWTRPLTHGGSRSRGSKCKFIKKQSKLDIFCVNILEKSLVREDTFLKTTWTSFYRKNVYMLQQETK